MNYSHVFAVESGGGFPILLYNDEATDLPPHKPCRAVIYKAMPDSGDRRWRDLPCLQAEYFPASAVRSFAVNGPFRIKPGKYGPGVLGSHVLIDKTGIHGQRFKFKANAFDIELGPGPLQMIATGSPSLFLVDYSMPVHFVSPSGGIPAKSGSTMGSATCVIYYRGPGGVLSAHSPGQSDTIYNPSTTAFKGSTAGVARIDEDGQLLAIVEVC